METDLPSRRGLPVASTLLSMPRRSVRPRAGQCKGGVTVVDQQHALHADESPPQEQKSIWRTSQLESEGRDMGHGGASRGWWMCGGRHFEAQNAVAGGALHADTCFSAPARVFGQRSSQDGKEVKCECWTLCLGREECGGAREIPEAAYTDPKTSTTLSTELRHPRSIRPELKDG